MKWLFVLKTRFLLDHNFKDFSSGFGYFCEIAIFFWGGGGLPRIPQPFDTKAAQNAFLGLRIFSLHLRAMVLQKTIIQNNHHGDLKFRRLVAWVQTGFRRNIDSSIFLRLNTRKAESALLPPFPLPLFCLKPAAQLLRVTWL